MGIWPARTKGRAPKRDMIIQERPTTVKPSLAYISSLFCLMLISSPPAAAVTAMVIRKGSTLSP